MKYNDRQKKGKKGKKKRKGKEREERPNSLWFFFSKILNPFKTITWKVQFRESLRGRELFPSSLQLLPSWQTKRKALGAEQRLLQWICDRKRTGFLTPTPNPKHLNIQEQRGSLCPFLVEVPKSGWLDRHSESMGQAPCLRGTAPAPDDGMEEAERQVRSECDKSIGMRRGSMPIRDPSLMSHTMGK